MATISVTQDDITTALRGFLIALIPKRSVILSQINRSPMPDGDFIVMTPLNSTGLSTSVAIYNAPIAAGMGESLITRTTRWTCQIDCYGQFAHEDAHIIATTVRTEHASELFKRSGIDMTPLYASDPIQTTMINGEQQYESRWTFEFTAQINPIVTTEQLFFDSITLDTKTVESIHGNSNQ